MRTRKILPREYTTRSPGKMKKKKGLNIFVYLFNTRSISLPRATSRGDRRPQGAAFLQNIFVSTLNRGISGIISNFGFQRRYRRAFSVL